jgi:hypothetical protein
MSAVRRSHKLLLSVTRNLQAILQFNETFSRLACDSGGLGQISHRTVTLHSGMPTRKIWDGLVRRKGNLDVRKFYSCG